MYSDGTFLAVSLADPTQATVIRASFERANLTVLSLFEKALPNFGQITIGDRAISGTLLPRIPLFAVSPKGEFYALARPHDAQPADAAPAGLGRRERMVRFELTLLNSAGDTLYSRWIEVPGISIPDRAIDSMIARRTPGLAAAHVASYKARVAIPQHWPPAVGMTVGADGRVWLQIRDAATTPTYLVLNREGRASGALALPASTVLAFAGGEFIWCLQTDENDVQSLVRYTVQ